MAHLLLINCPDEPGLVYKITGVLFGHHLNIIRNGEFVERHDNHFFMRTEFAGSVEPAALLAELEAVLPAAAHIRLTNNHRKDIVLMATKEHHCLSELLVRHAFGEMNARVLAVVSNYEVLGDLTRRFDIPFHFITHEGKSREAHEAEVLAVLTQYQPEFVVLAKYMRILSSDFVAHYSNRLINIHHSFLPAFVGASPYAQAYERGVKIIGATAHFVNEQLDQGPIISQSVIPIDHTQSAREMAQAGRDVEKIVLARSLKLVFDEQVFVHRNKTVIFD
ncbi:formyltetrahydrofolate deformylase [Hymenobacter sp. BT770]|uniref:formyltetrahydrofolate deformylase n=1 Tax=Hymenobacter sp. BT770 TaxID=2886942 RepID=UPI001D0F89DA|nr:formyltetrahydrofolate deformylase [Hymenobacter sp. BT770]MCC3152377.1 formyltetrahydrofolate deformylase [Hymenobacter sp. BT770]MDO3414647.1 formyltetrahydrofolate deformylase [Hymenobacter sp. BT770]